MTIHVGESAFDSQRAIPASSNAKILTLIFSLGCFQHVLQVSPISEPQSEAELREAGYDATMLIASAG
jgi:hypothetical protein